MFEFLMSPIVQVIAFVVFGSVMWTMGLYAGYSKKCREIKREEVRTAIKPSGVYLEDEWEQG